MNREEAETDLATLAISMHEETTVADTVDRVVHYARQAVGCDHAGVVFVHSGRRIETVAATDPAVSALEAVQTKLREGPDLSLSQNDRSILVADTTEELRWPEWGAAAAAIGFRSMVGARLYTSERTIGTLNLYDSRPCHFTEPDRQVAHVLARHAAIALWNSQNSQHLLRAVDSRKLIGQAQGILMERFGLDEDRAFALLRRYSQDQNVKLRTVAEIVVETRRLPDDVPRSSRPSVRVSAPRRDRTP
jgi:GAF domain-containing protein